ncbi:MAG: OmpA family protein [Weeksellaceae bacterium]|nr:OmpA family protein [Weeksellaceae bacterium]
MRRLRWIFTLLVFGSIFTQAQITPQQGPPDVIPQPEVHPIVDYYKWQVGVSVFATDHTAVRGAFDQYFNVDNWSVVPYPAKLTIVRGLNRSFDMDISANIGEVDNKRLMVENEFMINATMGLRYRFANGYILKQTSWFDPYLRLGAGYHKLDYQDMVFDNVVDTRGNTISNGSHANAEHFTVAGGLGINFWITKRFGLNVMSEYYHMPSMKTDAIDFFQHSAGVVFRFGQLDRDGDGIPDHEDECPDTPGLREFQGCPDTDGDGLPDHKDACPEEWGPIENDGCPILDRDGDGIPDDQDECPDVPGIIDYQGCPPPVRVIEPVTPEAPRTIVFEDVLFDFDKFTIRAGEHASIKEAAEDILAKGGVYYIDGHTDVRGSHEYNDRLSERRAQSVKDALVKEGVPAESLMVRGMGKRFTLCQDDTEACHQQNRRVEILRKE